MGLWLLPTAGQQEMTEARVGRASLKPDERRQVAIETALRPHGVSSMDHELCSSSLSEIDQHVQPHLILDMPANLQRPRRLGISAAVAAESGPARE